MKMPVRTAGRLASLILGAALGAAHAEVPADVAQRLLQQSGGASFLAGVSPTVQTYMLAAVDAAPQASVKRAQLLPLSQALQKAYAPERLRSQAAASLARQLSPQDAEALLAWYASPTGQRVSAAESQRVADGDASGGTLAVAMRSLGGMPAERRALLSEVIDATGVASWQTEVLIQGLQAIHRGTAGFIPQAAKVGVKDIKARLEAQRSELLDAYRAAGLGLAVRHYADLSDAQLQACREQQRSPAGEHLRQALQQAMAQALKSATEEAQRTVEVGAVAVPRGMPPNPVDQGGGRTLP